MLRDYIHVSEIVIGYMNACYAGWEYKKRPIVDILRLGSTRPYPVTEVIDTVIKVSKKVGSVSAKHEVELKGEIPNQHIVDLETQRYIGWYPETTLEMGLELTYPYYNKLFAKVETVK